MCALTPMFPNKQQEWYSSSTMEYPWLSSQLHSFSPSLHDLPSFLYPLDNHHHMSFSHSNGTNSNSNNGHQEVEGEEEEDRGLKVLEKKLNHNASERDRRRKLNALYSSLRDLMPPSDQKRKLSIPMTVARVVKYIPEQRQELQRLSKKKEELLKRKTMTLDHQHHHQEEMRKKAMTDSMSQQISANWLTDNEIALQIATSKWTSISEMILRLEENGFSVISVSSSVSSTARIFYTMHLEMKGDCKVRLEELNTMLFSGYERSKFHQGMNLFS